MQVTGFDRFLWATGFSCNSLLLLVLFRRGRARSFPIFTTFIAFTFAKTIVLYFIYRVLPGDDYAPAYRFFLIPDEILEFLVLLEVALHVFRPTGVWARDVWKTFTGIACVSVVVALPLAWFAVPSTATLARAIYVRGVFLCAVLMSELFVGMLALSATVGLPWKTHIARIAQGLGAYSVVCLVTDTISNYYGNEPHVFAVLDTLRNIVSIVCEGYWLAMLWQEAPAPRELPESMLTQIYALQRQVEDDLTRIRDWRRS
jgi:hypothetical protein